MPTYCYRDPKGNIHEVTMSVAEKEACEVTIDDKQYYTLESGVTCERDMIAEHMGFRNTPGTYPYYSDAMGVHPDQIPECRDYLSKRGVNAQFHPDGRVLVESKGQRKAMAEARGFYDRNGGYSDPQQRNYDA